MQLTRIEAPASPLLGICQGDTKLYTWRESCKDMEWIKNTFSVSVCHQWQKNYLCLHSYCRLGKVVDSYNLSKDFRVEQHSFRSIGGNRDAKCSEDTFLRKNNAHLYVINYILCYFFHIKSFLISYKKLENSIRSYFQDGPPLDGPPLDEALFSQ